MTVRPRPTLLSLLFALRGSILPQVAPTVIGLTAFAALVVAAEQRWSQAFPVTAGVGPFTLIGLALSIFLSFRNSACCDRWWEARKLWGALIVETRGLVRTLTALFPEPEHEALRRITLRGLCAFAHGLHANLRGTDEAHAAAPWLPEGDAATLTCSSALQACGSAPARSAPRPSRTPSAKRCWRCFSAMSRRLPSWATLSRPRSSAACATSLVRRWSRA